MGISISGLDDLNRFGVELGKISSKALPETDAVLKKGAQNVKDDLVSGARASRHFKGMAGSISYDSKYGVGSVGYEIGPDKSRKGGALGNIYYFGTSRGGGTGDLEGPLLREAPNLEQHLNRIVDGWADRL